MVYIEVDYIEMTMSGYYKARCYKNHQKSIKLMQKYTKFLVAFWLVKIWYFGNLIGGKILCRCSRKCAKKINMKFGVNTVNEFFLTEKNSCKV